jgi:hypothetical protein
VHLPTGEPFVHYLHHKFCGSELPTTDWWDQTNENLTDERLTDTQQKYDELLQSPGRVPLRRALTVTAAMMAGNDQPMRGLIAEKEHIFIVGAPRTGGTYLLKECLRAVGKEYKGQYGAVYHDAFPPVTSYREEPEPCRQMRAIYGFAQYFVMASLEDGEVIPKKLHTLTAESRFANKYLRNVYITSRHPADACMSMLARGGGMPLDRRMPRDRTNIERQVWSLLVYHGISPDEIRQMDYWDAYLSYWNLYRKESEQLNGVRVNYCDLPAVAELIHDKYSSGLACEPFVDTRYDRSILQGGRITGCDQPERGLGV